MCIKNKNYMENWLFWGLNLGNLKQCMMIMLVLTSSSSAWTLCSLLHISSLINICNFYSFWATGMVLTSKWGRILQEIHCQCQIWLKWSAAGRRPANFHKRNYLLSVNTTDFEKTTIQAHSAMVNNSALDVGSFSYFLMEANFLQMWCNLIFLLNSCTEIEVPNYNSMCRRNLIIYYFFQLCKASLTWTVDIYKFSSFMVNSCQL